MPVRPSTVPDLGAQGINTLKPQMAAEGPCSSAGLERFLADWRLITPQQHLQGRDWPKECRLGTDKSRSTYSSEMLRLLGWGSSLSVPVHGST